MNTQANEVPHSPLEPKPATPAVMAATRPFYWSVRRELWEYRSIYIAPLVVAGISLLGFVLVTIGRAMSTPDLARRLSILEQPYHFSTGAIMGVAFVLGLFYCLDALYGERRDRSILFWKSLPVSDLTAVLAKFCVAAFVIPLTAFVITLAMQWTMALLSTAVLLGSGLSAGTMWSQLWSFQWMLLYHLLTVHALWYAPIYAWLLLASAWAKRASFLWAGLPLLALAILEKILFGTTHFFNWLTYRFTGPEQFDFPEPGRVMQNMVHLSLGRFLSTPGLWAGLLMAAIFLAAAVRVRRFREPI